jgi:hypothetical protein
MSLFHHHHKVREPFYSIKKIAVGTAKTKRREGFRKRARAETDFGNSSVICRSLDGVNVASAFIWGIWTYDVEETPFGRLFRCEASLVTVHADAPIFES